MIAYTKGHDTACLPGNRARGFLGVSCVSGSKSHQKPIKSY